MNIQFSISREGKQVAVLVADVVKPADIATAVQRVFEKARKNDPVPLWDCTIEMRPAEVVSACESAVSLAHQAQPKC
jgi:hypothetical protein